MKVLYLDCSMGAAGDMLAAALLELLPEPERMMEKLNALGIPGVRYRKEKSVKCGITGTHVSVTIHGEEEHSHDHHPHLHDHEGEHPHHHPRDHHHSSLHHIEQIVRECLPLSHKVKEDVMAVYGLIAEAEGKAHGIPVEEIHFHEVGALDGIADITAVCMLMEALSPDKVVVSPVQVGSGQVKCAHGILPVPAPATAYLLQEIPIYGGSIEGELCTPTGAALLKYFGGTFGNLPAMRIQRIGYGMGKKDFQAANCLRAMLGETADGGDSVVELSCNIDDMTGEAMGYAVEMLFQAGALEVYTVPIGMKKSRPGTLLCVMCREREREKMIHEIFRHTTTIGIREQVSKRYVLSRETEREETIFGSVRKKRSRGYDVVREKYEYEDIAKIAGETGMSLEQVLSKLKQDQSSRETP